MRTSRGWEHAPITINVLGLLEIAENGVRFDIQGEKLRTIIAMLATGSDLTVPRDQLIDELWGDSPPTNPTNALQAHIARIRRLLRYRLRWSAPDSILRTTGTGYMLALPEQAVDAHCFLRLADEGARPGTPPARTIDLLERALSLWRGPALVDTGDGPCCRSIAFRLDSTRVLTQENLIDAKLALGRHQDLVPELEQLTAQNPLRERFADQLMRALYRCGRQADALAAYQRTRQRLNRELGIDPSPILQARIREILNQDPSLIDVVG
ncbi:MAG TPA: AfsR/SARP family transcriptional regulator [Streptosporangiaceae bacterium]